MRCKFCEKEIESSEYLEKLMNKTLIALHSKLLFTKEEIETIHNNLLKNEVCLKCDEILKKMFENKQDIKRSIKYILKDIKELENNTDTKSKIKCYVLKLIVQKRSE